MSPNNKLDIEQYGKEIPLLMPVSPTSQNSFIVDVVLRLSLLGSTLIAIALLVTSNQTVQISPFPAPVVANFSYAPAFV